MKIPLEKQHLYAIMVLFGVLFAALIPLSVFAEVVPLAPLPTNFGDNTDTLGGYINTIFYTIIAAAAVLAVLRIVFGGFQYMTSEAVTQTKDARTVITMAVFGLVLLLGSWLILNIINPDLTRLDVLQFENFEQADAQVGFDIGSETLSQEDIDSLLSDDNFERVNDSAIGDREQAATDVTNATNRDLSNLTQACRARGAEYSSSVQLVRTCRVSEAGRRYGRQYEAGEEYRVGASEQRVFGVNLSLAGRCSFRDSAVREERYFICERPI